MAKKKTPVVSKEEAAANALEELEASSTLVTREVPILDAKGRVLVKMRRSLAGPNVSFRPGTFQFFDKKTAASLVKSGTALMIDPSRDLTVNEVFELNHRALALTK